jgi:hypothetical protein
LFVCLFVCHAHTLLSPDTYMPKKKIAASGGTSRHAGNFAADTPRRKFRRRPRQKSAIRRRPRQKSAGRHVRKVEHLSYKRFGKITQNSRMNKTRLFCISRVAIFFTIFHFFCVHRSICIFRVARFTSLFQIFPLILLLLLSYGRQIYK